MQVVASGRLDARPGGVSVTCKQWSRRKWKNPPELCLQNKRGLFFGDVVLSKMTANKNQTSTNILPRVAKIMKMNLYIPAFENCSFFHYIVEFCLVKKVVMSDHGRRADSYTAGMTVLLVQRCSRLSYKAPRLIISLWFHM